MVWQSEAPPTTQGCLRLVAWVCLVLQAQCVVL